MTSLKYLISLNGLELIPFIVLRICKQVNVIATSEMVFVFFLVCVSAAVYFIMLKYITFVASPERILIKGALYRGN